VDDNFAAGDATLRDDIAQLSREALAWQEGLGRKVGRLPR
jgi:hypothetical protein